MCKCEALLLSLHFEVVAVDWELVSSGMHQINTEASNDNVHFRFMCRLFPLSSINLEMPIAICYNPK